LKINSTIAKFTIVSTVSVLVSLHAAATPAASARGGGHVFTGKASDASNVTRTVEIAMHDNYFDVEKLSVKKGETIRFVITNAGAFVHEFNIGTKAMHAAHGVKMSMMMRHGALEPDRINHNKMNMSGGKAMRHDDPNSVLLEPGKTAEIIWKFPDTAVVDLEFACNVPGHYDAGMVGNVHFLKNAS